MVKINENMNQLGTVYATKRRRRNGKSLKPSPKESSGKSNPSKRHRERLNAELDTLASLLPYEASILSKLDRLSILRLSVSYLRTKSYFQVSLHKGKNELGHIHDNQFRNRDLTVFDSPSLDGECFLQALNGFLVILTSDGEVFFATHTIESYLGFHQSDVVHQSVYELVHSEDREELQRQLTWSSQIPTDSGLPLMDALRPENCLLLERSFTVRFRCLLDNTSGFLRLDIRGRIKVLHGQNRKTEEPPLALFAICTPFGPPSLLELPHKESMFKSKHRLDMALVSMDQRGKSLLGYSDAELTTVGGYDLVHYDDLAYVASAHQELLKTGASGLIAYRLQTKDGQWQWLQTSSRLVYKNSKPDFIISTHRPLMEEEGRDLLGKRTMDFKVSYLDAGLASSYINDQDSFSAGSASTAVPLGGASAGSNSSGGVSGASRLGRKYKNQLRDFLSNCRTKRRSGTPEYLPETPAWTPSAAAAAAAYSPSVYPTPMTATAAPYTTDNGFYVHHQQNLQTLPNLQTFYPTLDNRFLPADNLFHGYRGLGSCAGYYAAADYSPYVHAAASTNSFLAAGYDSTMGMTQLYSSSPGASPADSSKYASSTAAIAAANRIAGHVSAGAVSSSGEAEHESSSTPTSSVDSGGYNRESRSNTRKSDHPHLVMNGIHHKGEQDIKTADTRSSAVTSSLVTHPGFTSANDTRQTVLMWGSSSVTSVTHGESSMGPTDISATPAAYGATGNGSDCHSEAKKYHHVYNGSLDLNLNNACKWGRVGSHYLYGAATAEAGTEVWPHPTQYYPYPTYHHHQAHHATADPHHNHPHPSHPHHPSPASHSSSYTAIGRTGVLCCPSPR